MLSFYLTLAIFDSFLFLYFITDTTLPTAAPAQGMCPDGFLQNPQMDCLKVHPTPMNWTQAKTSCESEHSSLVSILNVFDQAFVDVITADITTPVWTGLADQAVSSTSIFMRITNKKMF